MVDTQLRIQSGDIRNEVRFVFPGIEMPGWFREQSMGSSISVQLPRGVHQVKGIAFCIVLAWEKLTSLYDICCYCFHCDNSITVRCDILGNVGEYICCSVIASNECIHPQGSNHVLLQYDPSRTLCESLRSYCGNQVSFEFRPNGPYKVNQCGVLLVYELHDDRYLETSRILKDIVAEMEKDDIQKLEGKSYAMMSMEDTIDSTDRSQLLDALLGRPLCFFNFFMVKKDWNDLPG